MQDLLRRIYSQKAVISGTIELCEKEIEDYEKVLPMLETDGAIDQVEHLIKMNQGHIDRSKDEIHRLETIMEELEKLDREFV